MSTLKKVYVGSGLIGMTVDEITELYKLCVAACKDCPLGEGKNCKRTSFEDCNNRLRDYIKENNIKVLKESEDK